MTSFLIAGGLALALVLWERRKAARKREHRRVYYRDGRMKRLPKHKVAKRLSDFF